MMSFEQILGLSLTSIITRRNHVWAVKKLVKMGVLFGISNCAIQIGGVPPPCRGG